MKKTIALILVMLMCLSGFACASEERAEFDAACALLEAGDYDGAIAAFTSIGLYQEISEKLAEAKRLKDEQSAGFLYGNWIDLRNDVTYTFAPNGEGHTSKDSSLSYTCEDGMVRITQPWIREFAIAEINGVTHLQAEGYDLIREEDYAVAGPQTVEITSENWETYFEVREAVHVETKNAFGEYEFVSVGYGVFLRPEYQQRVGNLKKDVQVYFKYSEADDTVCHHVEFNAETFELTVGEPDEFWGTRGEHTGTISVQYWDPSVPYWTDTQFAGYIAAGYTEAVSPTEDGLIWEPIEDFTITDAIGTLKLLP